MDLTFIIKIDMKLSELMKNAHHYQISDVTQRSSSILTYTNIHLRQVLTIHDILVVTVKDGTNSFQTNVTPTEVCQTRGLHEELLNIVFKNYYSSSIAAYSNFNYLWTSFSYKLSKLKLLT